MENRTTRRGFMALAALATAGSAFSSTAEYRRGGMTYRRLGQTDIWLSLLSFGSHTDPADRVKVRPGKTVLTEQGQQRRDRMILRAFDYGVNLLDVYDSEGQWEPTARIVKDRRHKVLVSLAHEVSPKEIDRSCRLFGHVDLYRFHTAEINDQALHQWDILRRVKEAGKIRAIGLATHTERTMAAALTELDGLDYIFFPYNFIHARADYSEFLPAAIRKGVGLIGMKPLASGSIMKLDPRPRPGMKPEFEALQLWQRRNKPILPAAVAELTKSLNRMPDETLCMAAMRFVYAQRFLATAITGMFDEILLEDNYKALSRFQEMAPEERAALKAAQQLARLAGPDLLPAHYRWLEEQWGVY